ncbi:anaerobic ribonucleoside-triphosphate reductase-activating protein [Motilimonas sp. 1_MG-2023]|uniref:anaerobic ribonucleoside-triphosphate reductase-activating protein n=1 Tax=Motilimonas TaxID=1914248 RepID=UPI0026E11A48|nr:anaerobic ribonucleoside-triphosphate reductase-activating protein [Motilimonas sp. 1_MG-2023]MDO6524344.1 anaerobic ribonucleoside-triphosphate reductase-activating protein [Motilimonas sp. 1_MG-2023]
MHYQKYYSVDVVNGPGTRCTLFVSGCEHACKGCYNQATWRCDAGQPFEQAMVETIINDLNDPRIKRRGLSLSGGDPLHPNNLDAILDLVQQVKARTQGKDIWCWTGYTLSNLSPAQQKVVELVDVLIDGPFEQELADPSLKWRGSSNQIIHTLSE